MNELNGRQSDPIAATLDGALAVTVGALGLVGLLRAGASQHAAFFDFNPGDLQQLWELLEALGLTAGASRAGYWLWRKLSGKDKYFRAIWRSLDESPGPLTKQEIELRATCFLLAVPLPSPGAVSPVPKLDAEEMVKFEATWEEMRQKKVVVKVSSKNQDPCFDLGSDWTRKD